MLKEGFVLWFTGLPCSGKTTLADELAKRLKDRGMATERLDGDIVRQSLTKDLGFSKEDRATNLERVSFVCKLLSRNKVAVLSTFVSPYESVRQKIKSETTNFLEVYVKCSAEECAKRDVKGMWAKAIAGEIKGVTGHDDPYEVPINPSITIDTEKETIGQCVDKIILFLSQSKLSYKNLLEKAVDIARYQHEGQTRKFTGEPYFMHPVRVAERMHTQDEKIVAYLHDVVEDTDFTYEDLGAEGYPKHILEAVKAITQLGTESYLAYIGRVCQNKLATAVKISDTEDNLINQPDQMKIDRYKLAIHILKTQGAK